MSVPGSATRERRRPPPTAARLAVLAFATALALTACGERSFSAEEFVEEVNDQGVALSLDQPLSTEEGGPELYAITIGENPAGGGEELEIPDGRGGGSLRVEDDVAAAESEFARCEQAGLFCYRAANIVLIFEADVEADTLAELAKALKAIKAED